jgi:NAD(P)H-hydrate epimerase
VGIVAGSQGFIGAAVLCASGALRGGAGLVTVYAPEDIQPIVAAKMPPEVMVHPVKSYEEVLEEKHDVLAVGPGVGKGGAGAILQLVEYADGPMVLDADGLNIVAEHDTGLLAHCAGARLLTPHPGEMARLFPEAKGLSRYETATRFTARFAQARCPITLLLKGSRTIIHEEGKPASYNTTGNPGMGTGGMGDVLTGVCAALIGQHLSPYDAARAGAWICGRAAEIAVQTRSEESLAAMDVVECLGGAFRLLRSGGV